MAKISANGAREVARERIRWENGVETTYVLCSDGRALSKLRFTDGTSSGFTILGRHWTVEKFSDHIMRMRGAR